jgi:anti-sigma factor RsiW
MAENDDALQLTAYVDGELPEEARHRLEARPAVEPALKGMEQRLRVAMARVEALPSPQASAGLRRQVLAAVEPATPLERLRAWLTGPRLGAVGLAAAGAAAAVALWPGGEEPDEAEQVLLAQNLDLIEDLDVLGLDTADDLEVIASLHELEMQR